MTRMKKYFGLLMLTCVLITPQFVQGLEEESRVILTRDEAELRLLTDNTTIKSLEVAQIELLGNYSSVIEAGDKLEDLYGQLARYQFLENKYQNTMLSIDYALYFDLMIKGIGDGREKDLAVYIAELTAEDAITNSSLIEALTSRMDLELKFTEDDYAIIMSVGEYGEYQKLKGMFAEMGIDSPNLDNETIYDTFIYTMDVAPLSLQSALAMMQVNMEVVGASQVKGMNGLYDSILSMQGSADLMYANYISATNSTKASDAKLSQGLMTRSENRQVHIEEEKALLAYNQMARQIDSMTLSLKEMIGLDPSTTIDLAVYKEEPIAPQAIEDYLANALSERNEIISASADVALKESELAIMGEWFSDSSDRVEATEEALDDLNKALLQAEKDVQEDVIKAYNNVSYAALNVTDAENSLKIAEKEYEGWTLRSDLGYVLTNDLQAISISVISANNQLDQAKNTYHSAVNALEDASGIGPSYQ